MLSDEYGVKAGDIRWRNGGQEMPGRSERIPIKLPQNIELTTIPDGKTLNGMFETGELDAIITAVAPSCFLKGALPNVGRLAFQIFARQKRLITPGDKLVSVDYAPCGR